MDKETEIDESQNSWQQFYPTYSFNDKEILLKEYELSSNNILSEEKIFTNASNFTLLAATILLSVLGLALQNDLLKLILYSLNFAVPAFLMLFMVVLFTLKYFADRHKSVVFDSRKIVVLRSMMGLDYGSQQFVLPKWRIEGATNPFVIKHFTGWFSSVAFPFWIVTLFTSVIFYFLLTVLIDSISQFESRANSLILFCTLVWILLLMYIYRRELYDTHESFLLSVSKLISKFIIVKLENNFEYIIYRARLAKFEIKRMNVDLTNIREILICIEDKTFATNKGWSITSTGRAILSRSKLTRKLFKIGRASGGSTITQQLARTLFITDYHKTYRRKLIEIFLSKWMHNTFGKNEIIIMHLASVRYSFQTYGVLSAIKKFFNANPKNFELNRAKSFFLIERISNVRNRVMIERISALIKTCVNEGAIYIEDVEEIKSIYWDQVTKKGNLSVSDLPQFQKWYTKWTVIEEPNL